MKHVLLILINLCLLSLSLADHQDNPNSIDIDYDFSQLNFTLLDEGFQGRLTSDAVQLDLGYGLAPVYAYRLPEYSQHHTLILSSAIQKGAIFYPIVFLLNDDYVIDKEIKEFIRFRRMDTFGKQHIVIDIPVTPQHRYILITTDPTLYGKQIVYYEERTGGVPIYSGDTLIYVPSTRYSIPISAVFGEQARLKLYVPYDKNESPIIRQKGPFLDFGGYVGGETVADNPDGTNYAVGRGAVFGLGYGFPVFKSPYWTHRSSIGFRYLGGDGNAQGLVLENALVYSISEINLGVGIHADVLNSVEDINGDKTAFKDSLGPMVLIEWQASQKLNFGMKYIFIDYESKEGIDFDGDHLGFYLQIHF